MCVTGQDISPVPVGMLWRSWDISAPGPVGCVCKRQHNCAGSTNHFSQFQLLELLCSAPVWAKLAIWGQPVTYKENRNHLTIASLRSLVFLAGFCHPEAAFTIHGRWSPTPTTQSISPSTFSTEEMVNIRLSSVTSLVQIPSSKCPSKTRQGTAWSQFRLSEESWEPVCSSTSQSDPRCQLRRTISSILESIQFAFIISWFSQLLSDTSQVRLPVSY